MARHPLSYEEDESRLLKSPFNLDPRDSLATLRRLRHGTKKIKILKLLMMGFEIREVVIQLGVPEGSVKQAICSVARLFGTTEEGVGRYWWSAITLGLDWEKRHPNGEETEDS